MKRFSLLVLLGALVALASGCDLSSIPRQPPDLRAYVVPASIDRTGTLDVTVALNTFMRAVPDRSTIVFPAGARFRIEGVLVLNQRNNLRLEGNGARFFALTDGRDAALPASLSLSQHWPRHRGQFQIIKGTNITLRNLVIDGANPNAGANDGAYVPALEAQAGIDFAGTIGGLVEYCTITDTYGDFVYIGADAENIRVHGCTMDRSGRQGITVADAKHVHLADNHIYETGRSAIDLETYSTSFAVQDVTITNNDVGAAHGDFVAAKGGGDVSDIAIIGNRLHGQAMGVSSVPAGILPARRHNWLVQGNSSNRRLGSPHAAFYFRHVDGVRILDNVVPLMKGRTPAQLGVEFIDCTAVTSTGNVFTYV